MSIFIRLPERTGLIDLIDKMQGNPDVEPLDWNGLKERVRGGEITVSDWVQLYARILSLTTPPRSDAEALLHRARWYEPRLSSNSFMRGAAGTRLNSEVVRFEKFLIDSRDDLYEWHEIRQGFQRLQIGLAAVRAILNSNSEAVNHGNFEKIVSAIYSVEISEGTFANEYRWSEARKILDLYALFRYSSTFAHTFSGGEFSSQLLPYMRLILENHPDAFARYYILKLVLDEIFQFHFGVKSEQTIEILRIALRDREPLIALTAWLAIHKSDPVQAEGFSADAFSFGPPLPTIEDPGSEFRMHPDFSGPIRYELAEIMFSQIRARVNWPSNSETTLLSIAGFLPSHYIRDFSSYRGIRQPVMARKLEYLENLVREFGLHRQELIMKLFFQTPLKEGDIDETAFVLEFQSGKRILRQGHHRVAALIMAVANGLVPENWLEKIPVVVSRYLGPVPQALVDRVIGRGRWEDIFPDDLKSRLPQIIFRRPESSETGSSPPATPAAQAPAAPAAPSAPATPVPAGGASAAIGQEEITGYDDYRSTEIADGSEDVLPEDGFSLLEEGADLFLFQDITTAGAAMEIGMPL